MHWQCICHCKYLTEGLSLMYQLKSFKRTAKSRCTLIISWIHTNTTHRMQNSSLPHTRIEYHQKHSFYAYTAVLFSMGPHCLKGSLNEFWTISGIEIYWQNSNEPVCLPARLRGSHCPECSEHMLLSCAACLTAKGWFNYINCLMTEERAAGPCMLVCDKRGTLQRHGPHYTSLTVT